ncbi:fimbrial protein [Serratia fonticola]|uniref:Fimbrial protein n=1 Tax=Serratia fonticola TaxID=47917 RepID=A0AAJ1YBL8_SERFO|nr:fimbrial protein [Serratia fonticola]MDQ9127425.1 fimbrial protein [Serratia fonticola]
MTLLIKKVVIIALALIPLQFMTAAYASCGFSAQSAVKQVASTTQPLLGGNITVGSEVANGTVVYRQDYIPTFGDVTIACTQPGAYQYQSLFSSTPLSLASWNTGIYAGKVYQTGVQGLGVGVVGAGNLIVPYNVGSTAGSTCASTSSCIYIESSTSFWNFALFIIKIGPVASGSISGSQLPCISQSAGQSGSLVTIARSCFSGTLNVVSKTCMTPDVNVSMGTFDISQNFKGIGTATPWKDASINLTDCPIFYGTLKDGRNTFYSDNGTTKVGAFTNNTLGLTLAPNTSIIDDANGIMGLKTGSISASGIGIQLGYGNVGDASPSLVSFTNAKSYQMTNNAVTSLRLPLVARYIQTASSVTPGRADATATFTINYY